MCKIKLFCLKPLTKTLTEYRFEIHKDRTLKEATREAYSLCGLEDEGVAETNVRLVKYDEYHESFERHVCFGVHARRVFRCTLYNARTCACFEALNL